MSKSQKQLVIEYAKHHGACGEGLEAFKRAKGTAKQILTRWEACWVCADETSYSHYRHFRWLKNMTGVSSWASDPVAAVLKRILKAAK